MGRRLTSRQLGKRQTIAKAREDYLDTVRPPRAYQQAGAVTEYVYRSLQQIGNLWKIQQRISSANALANGTYTDTALSAADVLKLGLLASAPSGEQAYKVKGTGQKPTRIGWYHAGDTPNARTTPWGTTSVSFTEKTGTGREAQSHRSCAVGDPTATPTIVGMMAVVTDLMTNDKKNLLKGSPRGGIYLLPEISEISLE